MDLHLFLFLGTEAAKHLRPLQKILRLSWQQEVKRGLSMIVGTGLSKSNSEPNARVIDD